MGMVPMHVIESVFVKMAEIYADRWRPKAAERELMLRIWQSALHGMTAAEIKLALRICEGSINKTVPSPVQFYLSAHKQRLQG